MSKCKACGDKGHVPCPTCKGKGRIVGGVLSPSYNCKNCGGSGVKQCGACRGSGSR